MALASPPIDYAAARKALVAAIALGTGLSASSIVRAMATGPVQPPPARPFCTFQMKTAAKRAGYRDTIIAAPDVSPTAYYYQGHRGIDVDLDFFAEDQDTAYGLGCAMHGALFQEPLRQVLSAARLAVWTSNDVIDVTALLGVGFEPRASLEFSMWINTRTLVDLSSIDSVTIVGSMEADGGDSIETSTTADAVSES